MGAPIFNIKGEVAGAISVSGPMHRVTEDKIDFISNELIKCSNLISKEMGYKLN